MNIADIRIDYTKKKLSEKSVRPNPIDQFDLWLGEALTGGCLEPTAMIIATVSDRNTPSMRTVLLKGVENGKLMFYTNYNSRKGMQIANNPNICALFFWPELERQVNIEGTVTKATAEKSDSYFKSRPWKSRIGAIISPQSRPIESKNIIKKAFVIEAAKHIGDDIPRPDHWGGFEITPNRIEFWQGRPSRLHDRLLYTKNDASSWDISRLAP